VRSSRSRTRSLPGITRPTEVELAREFAVSRNTVGEGLRLLTRDGLARHLVHRGVSVRQFSTDEVSQIFDLRALIQREVARRAGTLTSEEVKALTEEINQGVERRDAGDARGWMNRNMDFHRGLVALLGNPRLDEMFTGLTREIRLILGALEREPDKQWDDGNAVLLDLLDSGDPEGYRASVSDYLARSCSDVVRLMGAREPASR
jgi:DNA-binding GntR family transcriptional regulator